MTPRKANAVKGRPPTARGAYNPNKPRQLGRVSDEEWSELQAAAKKSGLKFIRWALPILLKAARKRATE